MMRTYFLFLVLLGFCFPSFAQDQAIIGPESQVKLGDPIELDASKIPAEVFEWEALDCEKSRFRIRDQVLFFWPKTAGPYRFWFISSSAEAKLTIHKFTVLVIPDVPGPNPGPAPGPTPGPGPNPQPDPTNPFPDQKFGLSTLAFTEGSKVPNAKSDAGKLAEAFRGVAAKVDAGALSGQAAIVEETRNSNSAALGGDVARILQWKTVTGVALGQAMAKLDADGKLKNDKDISTAWKEFAAGLGAIK